MISVMDDIRKEALRWMGALLVVALVSMTLGQRVATQDQNQDQNRQRNQTIIRIRVVG